MNKPRMTENEVDEALNMHNEGKSKEEMVKHFGRGWKSIERNMERRLLEKNPA